MIVVPEFNSSLHDIAKLIAGEVEGVHADEMGSGRPTRALVNDTVPGALYRDRPQAQKSLASNSDDLGRLLW